MALIECTECGNDVSDRAIYCPNCGCPVSEILLDIAENERLGNNEAEDNYNSPSTLLLSILSFLFPLVGFLFGAAYIAADNEEQGIHFIRLSTLSMIIYVIGITIIMIKK